MTTAEEMLALARQAAEPSAETRARVAWAVQTALLVQPVVPAPGSTSPSPAAPTQPAWLATLLPFVAVGVITGAVGVVVGRTLPRPASPDSHADVDRLRPVPRAPMPASAQPPARPMGGKAPTVPLSPVEDLPAAPAPRSAARTTDARSPDLAPEPAPDSLSSVVAALQRAQAELRDGHPLQALLLLNELDRDYPSTVLLEERSAVRVHAQCAISRSPASLAVAREFVRAHPASLYTTRIKRACALE